MLLQILIPNKKKVSNCGSCSSPQGNTGMQDQHGKGILEDSKEMWEL